MSIFAHSRHLPHPIGERLRKAGQWQIVKDQVEQARTGAVSGPSVSMTNHITIQKTPDRSALEAQIDNQLGKLREQLFKLVMDGDIEAMTELRDDFKKVQGKHGDKNRPQPRGEK